MKPLLSFIALLFTCCAQLFSQPVIPEPGKISPEELSAQECNFEKDASAFYLLNYAKTTFNLYANGSYRVTTERRIRIKVINQKGYAYASISIPHMGNKHSSKITDLEAFIYTPGSTGGITKIKVDKKDIFKSANSKKNTLNMVKFTFPGLTPGCILEYSYVHIENDSYDIDPWLFQTEIPVALSYCEVDFPRESLLDFRLIGLLPGSEDNYRDWPIDSSKSTFRKLFLMKEVHSFRIEPMMSSMVDNLKRIEFYVNPFPGIFGSQLRSKDAQWKMLNTMLNMSFVFGDQVRNLLPGTEKFSDSVKQLKKDRDRINAVYSYVQKEMVWDKHQSKYPEDIAEAWKNKTGNSAEINMILLNLLQKAGVTCYPMLISTREHGRTDPDFPHLGQFNGLDVLTLDAADYFVLDASIKDHSFLIAPLNTLNRNVFVVMPEGYKWVNITENRPLIKDSVFVNAVLDNTGIIKGEAIATSFHLSREMKLSKEDDPDKNAADKPAKEITEIKIDSSWLVNREQETSPLTEHIRFHLLTSVTGDFYFLNPALFNSFKKNPFTDSTRSTDIDFICNQQFKQVIKLILPPEMEMETLPKSLLIRTVDTSMTYSRKITQLSNTVWIENEFTINQPVFSPEEYPVLWTFFKKVYALLAEDLVLHKKN